VSENAGRLRGVPAVAFVEQKAVSAGRSDPMVSSLTVSHSVMGEELRLLRARVRRLADERGISCLALTSALPGEGKSTVALGLAAALAREHGKRVLLIEADLRRPTLGARLGLPNAPGVAEWLNGQLPQITLRRVKPAGLFMVVAGQAPVDNAESLGSPAMESMLQAARGAFDFVLLDLPPVLPVADTTLVQDLVDGFLFVVRSRVTPREAIVEALSRLRAEKVLGLVLNDQHEYRHSYRNAAYKRYGMSYGVPRGGGPERRD